MFGLVDCNNFYVSCERVFNPALNHTPVVVLSNNDGCVISRSDEAKTLGIQMGAPAFKMQKLLNKEGVAVFSSNYTLYGDMSERVMNTLAGLVPEIEIYSIDEAFFDLTGVIIPDYASYAKHVKETILKWTGIPVSIGLAPTKTLAKIAGKKAKQAGGIFIFKNKDAIDKELANLNIGDVWGIGKNYKDLLVKNNIKTALDLTKTNDVWIRKNMTLTGLKLVNELRGTPCNEIESLAPPKKAVSIGRSFGKCISDIALIEEALANFAAAAAKKLRMQGSCATILLVFLETHRFKENKPQYFPTKAINFPMATNSGAEIISYCRKVLKIIYKPGFEYKKVGLVLAGLCPESEIQNTLFQTNNPQKESAVQKAMDAINDRIGKDIIRFSMQGYSTSWKLRQEKLSPCYTTRWNDLLTIDLESGVTRK